MPAQEQGLEMYVEINPQNRKWKFSSTTADPGESHLENAPRQFAVTYASHTMLIGEGIKDYLSIDNPQATKAIKVKYGQ